MNKYEDDGVFEFPTRRDWLIAVAQFVAIFAGLVSIGFGACYLCVVAGLI